MKKHKRAKTKSKASNPLHDPQPDAAGVDIAANEIWAAVPPERTEKSVRRFGAFTQDLNELVKWLLDCGVRSVAMESTGVYWIPLFQLLEQAGLKVCLVNARHVKNVPGRKSDVRDCQWLQYLHSVGLLLASFRPAGGHLCGPLHLPLSAKFALHGSPARPAYAGSSGPDEYQAPSRH